MNNAGAGVCVQSSEQQELRCLAEESQAGVEENLWAASCAGWQAPPTGGIWYQGSGGAIITCSCYLKSRNGLLNS